MMTGVLRSVRAPIAASPTVPQECGSSRICPYPLNSRTVARPWPGDGPGRWRWRPARGSTLRRIPRLRLRLRRSFILGGLIVAALAPGSAVADTYEVQPGDSLSAIAATLGLTPDLLHALNPSVTSPDLIYVGQRLTVPDAGVPDTAVPITTVPETTVPTTVAIRLTHTVQSGQSLSEIAGLYGVSVADLVNLNPSLIPNALPVGVELVIRDDLSAPPDPTSSADADRALAPGSTPRLDSRNVIPYLVQPGDTFSTLADRFGTTVATLLTLNPRAADDGLRAGAVIFAPRSGGAPPISSGDDVTVTPPPSGAATRPYTVLPGDTASGIALEVGVTLAQLRAANPDLNLNLIYVGQTLLLPSAADPAVTPASPGGSATHPYTVVAGDSAIGIALAHRLTLAQLQALNPERDLNTVYVGHTLQLPGPRQDGTPALPDLTVELTSYTVLPGDNATTIAAIHQITLDALAKLNPQANLDLLQIGAILTVPDIDLPPPPPGTVPAGPPPFPRYTVQTGDTLSAIAEKFGTQVAALEQLNPDIDPNLIALGDELRLPGTVPIPVASRTVVTEQTDGLTYVAARLGVLPHTLIANNPSLADSDWISAGTPLRVPDREGVVVQVTAGDTLAVIAAQYGTTVEAILRDPRSGVTDANALIIGQELIVPVSVPPFIWPASGDISDGFGLCRTSDCGVRHHGLDIALHFNPGGPVVAIAGGEVTFAGGTFCCGLGFYVEIDHGNGWLSRYGHLANQPPVAVGQRVGRGETIGFAGTTGFSTGIHLHLEMEHNGWLLDATNYLP